MPVQLAWYDVNRDKVHVEGRSSLEANGDESYSDQVGTNGYASDPDS
jgi:hypothetical protein